MHVILKYGKEGMPLEIGETPGFVGILTPSDPEPIKDPLAQVEESLRKPIAAKDLAAIARGKKNACIVVSDITRPVPNALLLPPLLKVLEVAGVPRSAITILIATGMHRPTTREERISLVGPGVLNSCKVVDHCAESREDMIEVGKIEGKVPALVNRLYVQADLKILTGFIEPHMWAGYSGGRKSILPGISSIETLEFMHGPEMIAHPNTDYGMLEGNLFHEAGLEIMEQVGADFIVNVTLNTKKEVTGVFSGHPVKAHLAGCEFLGRHCVRELDAPLDFIVTTNSGAPLDLNFYQTIKGITGAASAVKSKGDIIIASQCLEGAGSAEYKKILDMVDSPSAFVRRIMHKEFFIPDQWCAQETYQVLMDKDVWIYSDGLSAEDIRRYHMHPVKSIPETIRTLLARHGSHARWAVVPDGPMVILVVRAPSSGQFG